MSGQEDNIFTVEELNWVKDMDAALKPLKKEYQTAVLWLLYHINFLDLIDLGEIMSEEAEQEWTERAQKDNAYILMALIWYKKEKDRKRE